MYFENLLDLLKKDNSRDIRLSKIINPFSLYYLCNHYYGIEIEQNNLPLLEKKNNLQKNKNFPAIKDYDIIHCEVNYFEEFCKILPSINKKIILTTGQWDAPQIKKNNLTDTVLHNKNIVLWISQNPIYKNSDKYIAFPYGVIPHFLEEYSKRLILNETNKKKHDISFLPILNNTNPCRKKLPVLPSLTPTEFYEKLAETKYVISPIGDRDDCYRHYEAIGLGTIPISNVNEFYKDIFGNNMIYVDFNTMLDMVNKIMNNNTDLINLNYIEPNKNLICFEYYEEMIKTIIEKLKNN